ncbi:uncharacterized protein LOC115265664 [Aedes albopictus]|uniref:HTH CENPB-type domain-containing protein n=1 Tax=Aedes albopictus TaxID=7160 RepID=A0ABM1XWS0_AEDAL
MLPEYPIPLDLSTRNQDNQIDVPQVPHVPDGPVNKRQSKVSVRQKTKDYEEGKLNESVSYVQKGAMTTNFAAKHFGVPRTTLQYRLSTKCKNKGTTGPYPVFTTTEEQDIVSWLQTMERRGFFALKYKITAFLATHPRKNPFKDNVPGSGWFRGFLRRHPQLTIRTPEQVTSASAKVSEKNIREWFHTVKQYLIDHGLIDILLDPSRVYNGDESGFRLNPTSKNVIATAGARNVPIVETGNSKKNITVMFTFGADGSVVPPDVILAQKRLSKETVQSFQSNWGIGQSENGWMDTKNFVKYVTKILFPFLIKRGVKFPVIFFVDGHKSHMAIESADACKRLGIILIALIPNATRILQPADVGVFKPLKTRWFQVVQNWKLNNKFAEVTVKDFGTLLKSAMKLALTTSTIITAFAASGLYPFNPDAVDYTKCIAESYQDSYDAPGPSDTILNGVVAEEPPKADLVVPYTEDTATPKIIRINYDFLPQEFLAKIIVTNYDFGFKAPTIIVILLLYIFHNTHYHQCTTMPVEALYMLGPEKVQLYSDENSENLSHEDQVLAFVYKNILRCSNNGSAASDAEMTVDSLMLGK